jgi:tellurite resistance protein TerC
MLSTNIWLWIGFNLFVLAMLALDLGVFHRKAHTVSTKEALVWSIVWITLAMIFNVGLYFFSGLETALDFFTGYLIEKSLSVDNIFVFVLLFTSFQVPAAYQHRVLFWGVLGALIMRGILIVLGSVLLSTFHWIIYLFGAFLIFAGLRMAFHKETEVHPEQNPLLRLARRIIPVTDGYEDDRFIVLRAGRMLVTPLLLVLIAVETTDLIFALDSIPAIFAVTLDPFIVYTSNVFAILGLRSLYFVFAGAMSKFFYLKPGLAVILSFVGFKMVLADIYHIPTEIALAVIAVVLATVIVASVVRTQRLTTRTTEPEMTTHQNAAEEITPESEKPV